MKSTLVGHLNLASCSWLKAMISSGVASVPGALTTMALAVSPHFSWGTPMTATSAMPGCFISTFSTSAGYTFSPPDTIMSFTRSWM